MIDIDHLERRIKYRDDGEPLLPPSPEEVLALIAEIRRLRGERKGHRKCPCGGDPVVREGMMSGNFWIECDYCHCGTTEETLDAAWAAWDGVEE